MTGQSEQPYVPATFPISVKGVVLDPQERVLLLKNERAEWELPGGKLEGSETPEQRVETEIREESGWGARAGHLLDVWLYEPIPGRQVFIVTYGCTATDTGRPPVVSHEHKEAGLFHRHEVPGLVMPQGYKDSIARWYELHDRA
ncbi:NUDIX domain-containing protein [Actinacidiphila sp. DG2A-62]|uniref:NUDIX hydrolase n=1 Tax=Actinacidiphila sp. DG2A-62 TaxID=3108821 RepID=UPI002DB59B03|nr:NUDIX domain-containing protein [Actinacidiphila sp. DG2A-62]MEC3996079.1 NUDIX domain-containing protein [Actinacidiphila sp. DG2A-62]